MSEQIKETNVVNLWANQYPEVKRWLSKIQVKGKNAFSLYRFCQWCGKTPPELLTLKDNPASKEMEQLLDDFVIADIKALTPSVKNHCVNAVKSFFKHNYMDLSKACGVMTIEKVTPYHKLAKEGLRKLWNWALNPRDKALITFVCSTAIAKETLTKLQWKHLEENWEKVDLPCINIPSELLKGHGQGKYKGVRQITFLTPEAKRDLLNYKEWIEQKLMRKLAPEDNVFLETYSPYRPLSYYSFGLFIWRLSKDAGVPFSWHDAKRWVNTALEQINISPNWARKIRGRKVRGEEAPYSQPSIEQLREKFKDVVPLIEFTSERPVIPKEVQEKLAALEEEQRKIKQQYGIFRKVGKRKSEKEKVKKETNGGDCGGQKVVTEADLTEHLRQGWRVVTALPSGNVVIEHG